MLLRLSQASHKPLKQSHPKRYTSGTPVMQGVCERVHGMGGLTFFFMGLGRAIASRSMSAPAGRSRLRARFMEGPISSSSTLGICTFTSPVHA